MGPLYWLCLCRLQKRPGVMEELAVLPDLKELFHSKSKVCMESTLA